jgi:hypothetical protein
MLIDGFHEPEQMDVLQREILRNIKITHYYTKKIRGLLNSTGTGDIRKRLFQVMNFGSYDQKEQV